MKHSLLSITLWLGCVVISFGQHVFYSTAPYIYDTDVSHGGTLVQIDSTGIPARTVYPFNGSRGAYPSGSVVQAGNGKLYGVTASGGDNTKGVLFEYDPILDSLTVKKSLNEPGY